jgi:hypothetical protein
MNDIFKYFLSLWKWLQPLEVNVNGKTVEK